MIEIWFDKGNKTELKVDQARRKVFTDSSWILEDRFCSLSMRELRAGDQTKFIDKNHALRQYKIRRYLID
jgi:hypothetical protein